MLHFPTQYPNLSLILLGSFTTVQERRRKVAISFPGIWGFLTVTVILFSSLWIGQFTSNSEKGTSCFRVWKASQYLLQAPAVAKVTKNRPPLRSWMLRISSGVKPALLTSSLAKVSASNRGRCPSTSLSCITTVCLIQGSRRGILLLLLLPAPGL
ncbi:hypothetical protein FKM82_017365 [Ascaphus truei]